MHAMRIGLIAPPWTPVPPPLYGGIELVVDELARGLQADGHEVVLFTTGDSTCPVPRLSVLPEAEGMRIGMAVPELRHVLAAYEQLGGVRHHPRPHRGRAHPGRRPGRAPPARCRRW